MYARTGTRRSTYLVSETPGAITLTGGRRWLVPRAAGTANSVTETLTRATPVATRNADVRHLAMSDMPPILPTGSPRTGWTRAVVRATVPRAGIRGTERRRCARRERPRWSVSHERS